MTYTAAATRKESDEPAAEPSPSVAWRGSGVPTQILVLTGRSIRAVVLDPRMFLVSLMGPLFMLLVFSQVFGGMAAAPNFPPGIGYGEFLMPALLVNWSLQTAIQSGVGLAQDMRNGIITRFRSLPIWLGSILVARSLADLIRSGQQLLGFLVSAFVLFGVPSGGGVAGAAGAWLLAVLVGTSLSWVFMAIACWVRTPELMQGAAALIIFPLMFASSAFVPVSNLPGWLRTVAGLNPMTHAIDAARDLMFGRPALAGAATALGVAIVVAVSAARLAVWGFRRHM